MERMQKRLLLATILAAKDWRGLARSISVNVFFRPSHRRPRFVYGLVMIPVALDSLPPPAGKVVAFYTGDIYYSRRLRPYNPLYSLYGLCRL